MGEWRMMSDLMRDVGEFGVMCDVVEDVMVCVM